MDSVAFCRALADETRQAILKLLQERGEMCVSDIVAAFDKSQPAISHHLGILQATGLVRARRDGRQIYYRLDAENLTECCGMLWSKFEPVTLTLPADGAAEAAPAAVLAEAPITQAVVTICPPLSFF